MNRETPEAINHYADALVALGRASGRMSALEKEVQDVLTSLESDVRLKRFLRDPVIKREGKRKTLESLFENRLTESVLQFLSILLDNNMLRRFPDIADAFFEKSSGLKGEAAGEIASAVPLSPETVAAVQKEAGAVLGRPVKLRTRLDPSLIGGAVVRVGDFVLDASVERRLQDTRHALLAE